MQPWLNTIGELSEVRQQNENQNWKKWVYSVGEAQWMDSEPLKNSHQNFGDSKYIPQTILIDLGQNRRYNLDEKKIDEKAKIAY